MGFTPEMSTKTAYLGQHQVFQKSAPMKHELPHPLDPDYGRMLLIAHLELPWESKSLTNEKVEILFNNGPSLGLHFEGEEAEHPRIRGWYKEENYFTGMLKRRSISISGLTRPEGERLIDYFNSLPSVPPRPSLEQGIVHDTLVERTFAWRLAKYLAPQFGLRFHGTRVLSANDPKAEADKPAWLTQAPPTEISKASLHAKEDLEFARLARVELLAAYERDPLTAFQVACATVRILHLGARKRMSHELVRRHGDELIYWTEQASDMEAAMKEVEGKSPYMDRVIGFLRRSHALNLAASEAMGLLDLDPNGTPPVDAHWWDPINEALAADRARREKVESP